MDALYNYLLSASLLLAIHIATFVLYQHVAILLCKLIGMKGRQSFNIRNYISKSQIT